MKKPIEELLALALEQRLAGNEPDARVLAGGDEELAAELGRLLGHSAKILTPAAPRAVPAVFGAYEIERELGRGATGHVLLGVHRVLRRRAAIKVLPRPYAYIAENRERFQREAQALAQLGHPGIVPIHEVGEQDGVPYAVLELIEDGTLEDFLAEVRGLDLASARNVGESRLPGEGSYEQRVAELLAQVAETVHSIHEAGIVHRDIKPANLLVASARGRLLLSDFGLALQRGKGTLTQSGAIVGTRQYLAPELTRPGGKATETSDVFAIGVTLFEMLTFVSPFAGESEESLYTEIRERDPELPRKRNRHVSRDLEAVCLKALEKAPGRRYASAAALAADLHAAARGEPVIAGRRSSLRRAVRGLWYRRRAVGVATASVLGIALIALVGWEMLQRRQQRIEKEWVDSFQAGEVLLLSGSARFATELNEANLVQALQRFGRCTELFADRAAAWLRYADVAARLKKDAEAAHALTTAETLGERGWYAQSLRSRIRGEPEPSLEPIEAGRMRSLCEGWSLIDRLALAARLMNEARDGDAWEIVSDSAFDGHPWFVIDAIRGMYLERGRGAGRPIFVDPRLQVRVALAHLDRFLAHHPHSQLVALDRALLIRNVVVYSKPIAGDLDQLFDEALRTLEDYRRSSGSLHAIGLWIDALCAANRPQEALAELLALTADERTRLPLFARVTAVKLLVGERRHDLAFELLETPFMDGYFNRGGPLERLVAVHLWLGMATQEGQERIKEFARTVQSRVTSQDWGKAMANLAALDEQLAPSAAAEQPRD